jgi:hypothetical protein
MSTPLAMGDRHSERSRLERSGGVIVPAYRPEAIVTLHDVGDDAR